MSRYVARKRARFKKNGKKVNIPWGTVLEEQGGFLIYQGKRLCAVTGQNAHDYFSLDDDGQGYLRGVLVDAITLTLEKQDADYQARWDKIWESPLGTKSGSPRSASATSGRNMKIIGSGITAFTRRRSLTCGRSQG